MRVIATWKPVVSYTVLAGVEAFTGNIFCAYSNASLTVFSL